MFLNVFEDYSTSTMKIISLGSNKVCIDFDHESYAPNSENYVLYSLDIDGKSVSVISPSLNIRPQNIFLTEQFASVQAFSQQYLALIQ